MEKRRSSSRDEEIDVELNSERTAEDQSQESAEEEDDAEQTFNHVWFTGWANFEEPRLVVTVVLDNAKSGSDDAGPIVQRILEGTILNNWVP